jgi:hypothetical protein
LNPKVKSLDNVVAAQAITLGTLNAEYRLNGYFNRADWETRRNSLNGGGKIDQAKRDVDD